MQCVLPAAVISLGIGCAPFNGGPAEPGGHRAELSAKSFTTIDLTHDHGPVSDGVAVYTRDGDRQAFPDKPHFRVRAGKDGKLTTWISGKGYAVGFGAEDLDRYAKVTGGRESSASKRFPSSARSPKLLGQYCDPAVFDCGTGGGDGGPGWSWPTGCGDDGYQSCVQGLPGLYVHGAASR